MKQQFAVTLICEGVDGRDDAAAEALMKKIGASLDLAGGQVLLTCCGDAASAERFTTDAVRAAEDAWPGLQAVRVDPDLLNLSGIARRLGRTRQSVQQWQSGGRRANTPFPAPLHNANGQVLWDWASVNEWLRPLGLADDEHYLDAEQRARVDVWIADRRPMHEGLASFRSLPARGGLTYGGIVSPSPITYDLGAGAPARRS